MRDSLEFWARLTVGTLDVAAITHDLGQHLKFAHQCDRPAALVGQLRFFPSRRKPGCCMGPMNKTFDRTIENAGLHFNLYDFRHTFATRAGQSGMDIKTLAEILGHANLRTVARYIHPTQEHKKAAMDRLEAYKAMMAVQAEKQAAATVQ